MEEEWRKEVKWHHVYGLLSIKGCRLHTGVWQGDALPGTGILVIESQDAHMLTWHLKAISSCLYM